MKLRNMAYLVFAFFIASAPVKGLLGEEKSNVNIIENQKRFGKVPSSLYEGMRFIYEDWKGIAKGMHFTKVDVYRNETKVDTVAIVKADPVYNSFKVFSGFNQKTKRLEETLSIEGWQRKTGASIMFNSAQYAAQPFGMPIALIKCSGNVKGLRNKQVRGVFVAEPLQKGLPLADLLDLKYEQDKTSLYSGAVQHWPILLDRNGNIRVKSTDWQASRTVIAKDTDGNILSFVTEGGYFTLYNFGRFLRDNKEKLNVHTAMNLDGGYEADMIINLPNHKYITYGWAETYGEGQDASAFGKIRLPGVIGIFPRY